VAWDGCCSFPFPFPFLSLLFSWLRGRS
jgi:hypothetical protein